MRYYVAKITETEKMVYMACVRYSKKDNKYDLIPFNLSVKKENCTLPTILLFPLQIDVKFVKGVGAVVSVVDEKV